MQNAIINLNGTILNPDDAKVSVFDRSFLYGDSLYEVVRTYKGQFFLLDDHLKRLENSARLCRMTLSQTLSHLRQEINRTFLQFRTQPGHDKTEAYARIVISRGVGKIGFGLSNLMTPTQYVIIVQPVDPPTAAQMKKGLTLQISHRVRNDQRALDPAMKSGNYLNSLLAYLDATEKGFDDALLCNADGHLTEGTTFNIFYVRRGIVATPPLDVGILDGITRRHAMQLAAKLGIPVREVRFPKERLVEAEEVFLTSSVREVMPVHRIDDKTIGTGSVGPITQKLQDAYKNAIRSLT